MDLSAASIDSIKQSIKKAIRVLKQRAEQPLVTDIYLQPNTNTGAFVISDDNDAVLASTTVDEWTSLDNDDFHTSIAPELRNLLQREKEAECFSGLDILKPYSFVLIDEEGEVVEDLLLIDDDLLIVNSELLKGLDEELDSFLKHLLED